MVRRWYCRVLGEQFGPLTFRELARLVRDGSLSEDDDVRPDYQKHWQSADTVIGLYYMAFRAPGGTEDPDANEVAVAVPPLESASEEDDGDDNDPAMLTLMEAIARKRQSADGSVSHGSVAGDSAEIDGEDFLDPFGEEGDFDLSAPSELTGAIADAVAVADEKTGVDDRRRPWWIRFPSRLISGVGGWHRTARWGYLLAATAVAANGTSLALMEWSDQEQLRFPSREKTAMLPYFPGIGRCGEFEYWILFGHTVFFAGLVVFLAARWLLNRAE